MYLVSNLVRRDTFLVNFMIFMPLKPLLFIHARFYIT